MAMWSVTKPNSLFTNLVCPHPWKLWPCTETTWLSADLPVSAAALWYQEWRVLRGGAGKWPQKPSVADREWGYLPCSLRWGLISHVACACIHIPIQVHKHTYTQLVQKFVHVFPGGQMRFVCEAFRAWHQDKSSHITKYQVTDSHCSVGNDIEKLLRVSCAYLFNANKVSCLVGMHLAAAPLWSSGEKNLNVGQIAGCWMGPKALK